MYRGSWLDVELRSVSATTPGHVTDDDNNNKDDDILH